MEQGTRVALARDQRWTGTTGGREHKGTVHVVFDKGGAGNLRVGDLVVLDPEGGQWPPPMETKTG
jgi:hypothetical protein